MLPEATAVVLVIEWVLLDVKLPDAMAVVLVPEFVLLDVRLPDAMTVSCGVPL